MYLKLIFKKIFFCFLAFQATVLQYLETLTTEVKLLSSKVGSLEAASNIASEEQEQVLNFPLLTEIDVEGFQEQLEAPVLKNKLVTVNLRYKNL